MVPSMSEQGEYKLLFVSIISIKTQPLEIVMENTDSRDSVLWSPGQLGWQGILRGVKGRIYFDRRVDLACGRRSRENGCTANNILYVLFLGFSRSWRCADGWLVGGYKWMRFGRRIEGWGRRVRKESFWGSLGGGGFWKLLLWSFWRSSRRMSRMWDDRLGRKEGRREKIPLDRALGERGLRVTLLYESRERQRLWHYLVLPLYLSPHRRRRHLRSAQYGSRYRE